MGKILTVIYLLHDGAFSGRLSERLIFHVGCGEHRAVSWRSGAASRFNRLPYFFKSSSRDDLFQVQPSSKEIPHRTGGLGNGGIFRLPHVHLRFPEEPQGMHKKFRQTLPLVFCEAQRQGDPDQKNRAYEPDAERRDGEIKKQAYSSRRRDIEELLERQGADDFVFRVYELWNLELHGVDYKKNEKQAGGMSHSTKFYPNRQLLATDDSRARRGRRGVFLGGRRNSAGGGHL